MLWFKSLIGFLFVYLAYNGLVLLGSDVRYVFKDLQHRSSRQNILLPSLILLVLALLIFLMDYPLGLMITASIPVSPVIVGGEIVVALVIRHEQITQIL